DPPQLLTGPGGPDLPVREGLEVAEGVQHVGDAVEGLGDGVGAALDLAQQPVGVPAQRPPALGPAGVALAVRAAVAGVSAQGLANLGDAPFGGAGAAVELDGVPAAAAAGRAVLMQGVAHGRGEVA